MLEWVRAADQLDNRRLQRLLSERERARESRVLTARSVRQRGCHRDVGPPPGHALRERSRDHGIRVEREVRAMLLGGA
jgi:hypothetical protein